MVIKYFIYYIPKKIKILERLNKKTYSILPYFEFCIGDKAIEIFKNNVFSKSHKENY